MKDNKDLLAYGSSSLPAASGREDAPPERVPTPKQIAYLHDVALEGWLSEGSPRRRHLRRACLAAGWIYVSRRGAYGIALTSAGKTVLNV